MPTIHERLDELTGKCGFYHLPANRAGGNGETLRELESKGLEVAGVCTDDSRLFHVILPHSWQLIDDENARSADNPADIGSVLIVADGTSLASIVAGNHDPHDYGLVLP